MGAKRQRLGKVQVLRSCSFDTDPPPELGNVPPSAACTLVELAASLSTLTAEVVFDLGVRTVLMLPKANRALAPKVAARMPRESARCFEDPHDLARSIRRSTLLTVEG